MIKLFIRRAYEIRTCRPYAVDVGDSRCVRIALLASACTLQAASPQAMPILFQSATATATETIPPSTPLPSLTPSRTLLPPPTFEPPTLTPIPSATPAHHADRDARLSIIEFPA